MYITMLGDVIDGRELEQQAGPVEKVHERVPRHALRGVHVGLLEELSPRADAV